MTALETFPTEKWDTFISGLRIRQGEHVTVIKPTGGGKSTLISELMDAHRVPAIVVLVTKAFDKTFDRYFSRAKGWHRVEDFVQIKSYMNRVLIWPKKRQGTIPEYIAIQRRVFRDAINGLANQLGWSIVCDEENYLCETLGLTDLVKFLHHQGRSSGLTCWTGIQRPSWVPVITYSSATHAFVGYTNDLDDLKKLSNLGGSYDRKIIQHNLSRLDFWSFLYLPARVPGRSPVVINTAK